MISRTGNDAASGRGAPARGFTLVEVLLVVLVLAVAAGLAVPGYGRAYRRFQLKEAAENLAYVMRYAGGRAVMKARRLRLEFDDEFASYRLMEEAAGEDGARFVNITGRLGKVFRVPEDFRLEADQPMVLFYPDGRIDGRIIHVCDGRTCFTISTKEQRGHVWMFDTNME